MNFRLHSTALVSVYPLTSQVTRTTFVGSVQVTVYATSPLGDESFFLLKRHSVIYLPLLISSYANEKGGTLPWAK